MKRLFPRMYQSTYVRTSRIDPNVASSYNAQRSMATTGSRGNTEHKLDNNFMEEVPKHRKRTEVSAHEREVREAGNMNIFELYRKKQTTKYFQVTIEEIGEFKLILLSSGQENMFVQEYQNVRRLSRIYIGRDVALKTRELNRIHWIITEAISL